MIINNDLVNVFNDGEQFITTRLRVTFTAATTKTLSLIKESNWEIGNRQKLMLIIQINF